MLNFIMAPFIIIGLIQYRKKKSKLLFLIGIVLFISFMIYLGYMQTVSISGFNANDARAKKRLQQSEVQMDSLKLLLPEKERMEFISTMSLIIAAHKYLVYGTKTNYYDNNGNIIQYQPSEKERELWNYKNELYTGWYKIFLYPIATLFISVLIGFLIPLKGQK